MFVPPSLEAEFRSLSKTIQR